MNRINRIDASIKRLKLLISRKMMAGLNVTSQLVELDGLQDCKKGMHHWVVSSFVNDEYCRKCLLNVFYQKQKLNK